MSESSLSARTTTPDKLYANEIAAWEKLSTAFPSLFSPFLSLHFARAVAESGMDVRICIIYRNQTICGFFPYQFRNHLASWTKTAEPVGGGMTDYFGLIAEPDFRITADQLLKLAQVNYLGFSHLDESQMIYGLKGEQPRIGLRARLDQDVEDPLEALISARLRYLRDSERCARKLFSDFGQVDFDFDAPHDRHQILENLINHKRAQYRKTNVPDALENRWKQDLLHKLSEYRFVSCRGVLSTMSVDGHWIAAHFGIMGNGVFQYWMPVYNPEFAKYAPGRLLLHHIIKSSRSTSIHTIDHGEGDTASKRDLANEEYLLFRGVWHNKSVTSQVTRGFYSIKWRLGV
jgi:CelD/BcsL family acetyltransferase involved in cellulose biosynthesis